MQPLSYQVLPCSCWVTSVTNGLLCLFKDKNRIPGLVLRLLHVVLTDEGVLNGGSSKKKDWEIVLNAVKEKCNLGISTHTGIDVEQRLLGLDFNGSVVISDIGAGTHSILLNGRDDDWFLGFDPDWDQVKKGEDVEGQYQTFANSKLKKGVQYNVRIHKEHLFRGKATKKQRFAMGSVRSRTITVISKNND